MIVEHQVGKVVFIVGLFCDFCDANLRTQPKKNCHFCAFFCVFCLKTAKKNLKICIIEDKIVSLQQIIRQSQESIWKQQGKKEHARKSVQPLGLLCVKEKKNKGLLK